MKQNWETKQFEDCIEKVVYTNKIKRKDFLENGEYPIISQEQDFINGYWDNQEDLCNPLLPLHGPWLARLERETGEKKGEKLCKGLPEKLCKGLRGKRCTGGHGSSSHR